MRDAVDKASRLIRSRGGTATGAMSSEGYTRTAQEARCRFSRIEKGRMRAERAATAGRASSSAGAK